MKALHRLGLAVPLALSGLGPAPQPKDVSEIRIFDHEQYTRVVIQLSDRAEYRVRRIARPPRLYVDIEGARIEPGAAARSCARPPSQSSECAPARTHPGACGWSWISTGRDASTAVST